MSGDDLGQHLKEQLEAINRVALAGMKSGREIAQRDAELRAKPLIDSLKEMEEGYRERCHYCGGSLATCDGLTNGCRAQAARAALAEYKAAK